MFRAKEFNPYILTQICDVFTTKDVDPIFEIFANYVFNRCR
jgi:hypothetical protein